MTQSNEKSQSSKNFTQIEVLKTKMEFIQAELKVVIGLNISILLIIIGYIFKVT